MSDPTQFKLGAHDALLEMVVETQKEIQNDVAAIKKYMHEQQGEMAGAKFVAGFIAAVVGFLGSIIGLVSTGHLKH